MGRKSLLWQQGTKKELGRKIKKYKTLKIRKSKKPSWFTGKWKETYTIEPKKRR